MWEVSKNVFSSTQVTYNISLEAGVNYYVYITIKLIHSTLQPKCKNKGIISKKRPHNTQNVVRSSIFFN